MPVSFTGGRLELNARVREGGSIVVSLLDAAGKELPGFEASEPITGDNLRHEVRWQGTPDLAALAGQAETPDTVKPPDTFRISRTEPLQLHTGYKLADKNDHHQPVDHKGNDEGCVQVFETRESGSLPGFFVQPPQACAQKGQNKEMR